LPAPGLAPMGKPVAPLDTGFVALPVTLRQGATTRRKHLFLRAHRAVPPPAAAGAQQAASPLGERALFVAGLPFLNSELDAAVARLFGAFGSVERIAVHAEQARTAPCCPLRCIGNTGLTEALLRGSSVTARALLCAQFPALSRKSRWAAASVGRRGQTSAIVVFDKAAAAAKALRAAADGKGLELELPAPDQPYGLKGAYPTLNCYPCSARARVCPRAVFPAAAAPWLPALRGRAHAACSARARRRRCGRAALVTRGRLAGMVAPACAPSRQGPLAAHAAPGGSPSAALRRVRSCAQRGWRRTRRCSPATRC